MKAPFHSRLAVVLLAGIPLTCACSGTPSSGLPELERELTVRLGHPVGWMSARPREVVDDALRDGMLTVDEATHVALVNNAGLRGALEDLVEARAELADEGLLPNVTLGVEYRIVESGGHVLELAAAQDLLGVLLRPLHVDVAQARLAATEARVAAAVIDLVVATRATYRRLQAELATIDVLESSLEATFLGYDAARRLHEAGNTPELDVLTERALHEEVKLSLAAARARASARREELDARLGFWGGHERAWSVEPRLPPAAPFALASEDLEQQVVAASLDLVAARAEVEARGHLAQIASLEPLLPRSWGAVAEQPEDGAWEIGPALTVSLPIFDQGRAAAAAAEARTRAAFARYTQLALSVRAAARAGFTQAQTAAQNARFMHEVVLPLRTQVTAHTQQQFNAMQTGVFELLDAKRREIDAARRYVDTLLAHWLARGEVESLLLGRLPPRRADAERPGFGDESEPGPAMPHDEAGGPRR